MGDNNLEIEVVAPDMSANAVTSGVFNHAVTTGKYGHATTTGDDAHAAATGFDAHASATGDGGIAASIGQHGTASGALGSWLVLAHYTKTGELLEVRSIKVDGDKVLPNTTYRINTEGELIEVTSESEVE